MGTDQPVPFAGTPGHRQRSEGQTPALDDGDGRHAAGVEEGEEEDEEIEASLFDLMEALRDILKKVETQEKLLDFTREKVSLKDKMVEIMEKLNNVEYIVFQELFSEVFTRYEVIVTFVALLELIREQKIKALQFQQFGAIRIYPKEEAQL